MDVIEGSLISTFFLESKEEPDTTKGNEARSDSLPYVNYFQNTKINFPTGGAHIDGFHTVDKLFALELRVFIAVVLGEDEVAAALMAMLVDAAAINKLLGTTVEVDDV